MYKQLKKIPRYLFKWMRHGSARELFHLIKNVKTEHLLIALAARVDRKLTHVRFKDCGLEHEINQFMDLIPHRRKRVIDDIYLWEFGRKRICGNYMQMLGLRDEYLTDLFDAIYKGDWKDKQVLDIGGFVGDTALYFLSQGASRVIIYEPVPKNVKALQCNLKGYEHRMECHQKALSRSDGPLILNSDEPECSSGFGMSNGKYQIECEGVTIGHILRNHAPIDVAKVDCEGGEIHLLDMSKEEICSVPDWIVETHSDDLYASVKKKFSENGFLDTYDRQLAPSINILHFHLLK